MTMVGVEVEAGRGTELVVPGGCLVCDGDLHVRLTPEGAWGYCSHCRWLTQAELRMEQDGLHLSHAIAIMA